MDYIVNRALLRETQLDLSKLPSPRQAQMHVRKFGQLAPWWLDPQLLERAAQDCTTSFIRWLTQPPRLDPVPGGCWVVLARVGDNPLLREAFLLPLQWRKDQEHSSCLPAKLVDMADDVRDAVEIQNWGLHLAPCLEGVDLSDLDEVTDFASGWAALAGGLMLAKEEGSPDPRVWVSGAWDVRHGIQRVEHLEAKIRLAREYDVSHFFVPQSQEADARPPDPHVWPVIGTLKAGTRNPETALRDYLLRLDAPPPGPEGPNDVKGRELAAEWYLRHPRQETKDFYKMRLLPTIIELCREQVKRERATEALRHLVTIVSGSPELVEISTMALGIKSCLLLHTDDKAEEAKTVRSRLDLPDSCKLASLGASFDPKNLGAMRQHLKLFLADKRPEEVAVDLTPGTKAMTYALARLAPAGSWLLYLENKTNTPDKRPRPFTENVLLWQASADSLPENGVIPNQPAAYSR